MEMQRDAYCGLFCGACPIFLANESGTVDALAMSWKMKPEELVCYGCKSGQVTSWCTTCGIKQCAQQKGYEFCGQCPDAPCDQLTAFIEDEQFPYHLPVMKNLDAIRAYGVAAWLQAQDARWRCPACDTKFAWRDTICDQCGGQVSNYQADI
jgi:hypothetical protein